MANGLCNDDSDGCRNLDSLECGSPSVQRAACDSSASHSGCAPRASVSVTYLARIRREASSEAEKGRWFEHLFMADGARQTPEFDVADIWPWRDWPERERLTGLDGRDHGIDLVAVQADGTTLIQHETSRPRWSTSPKSPNLRATNESSSAAGRDFAEQTRMRPAGRTCSVKVELDASARSLSLASEREAHVSKVYRARGGSMSRRRRIGAPAIVGRLAPPLPLPHWSPARDR